MTNDPRAALEAAGVPPENIKIFDSPKSMLEEAFGHVREPRPKTLEEALALLDRVGEHLAVIYEIGTFDVRKHPKGFRWPWSYEAEQALKLMGKMAYDFEPQNGIYRTYWDTDYKMAVLAREKCGCCGKPPHGDSECPT